jgi:uncharacterized protein YgiM (DUF1202 family)
MLRLTFILCIGLLAALMIAGEDRGQLRPGLADAAARAALPAPVAVAEPPQAEALTVVSADPLAAAPLTQPAAVASAEPETAKPEPYVEPEREVVIQLEEPVFSLASVGTEAVPTQDPEPETADGGLGTIWYVVANTVNVRAGPSTEAEIVGKLASGEATLMVQSVDEDWARIVIQGDGVEGFVAKRYLSSEAP